LERKQYRELVSIPRRSGSVGPFRQDAPIGRPYCRDEYHELPSTVRGAKGKLDMYEASQVLA
jgi:hypothetical protein